MKDDWSLKRKRWRDEQDEGYNYTSKDIETLRKKILEDIHDYIFEQALNKKYNDMSGGEIVVDIEFGLQKQINKRFGVKE